jgi:release factor glutamine methyltransferase
VPGMSRLVADVARRLGRAGCVAADEEASELVGAATGEATLRAWVRRRERGEPLAWIVGSASFCGRPVHVGPGVFVPRTQTEELARRAATLLDAGCRAADLCTGAGAVAAHLAAQVPGVAVVGVDIDPRAVRCARRNGVAAVVGDLAGPLCTRTFDVVTCVAPYVPTAMMRVLPADVQRYEPRDALDGGGDGLDVLRRVVTDAARVLRPTGHLLVELGGNQDALLAPVLDACGFCPASTWRDDDGDLRGLATRLCAA